MLWCYTHIIFAWWLTATAANHYMITTAIVTHSLIIIMKYINLIYTKLSRLHWWGSITAWWREWWDWWWLRLNLAIIITRWWATTTVAFGSYIVNPPYSLHIVILLFFTSYYHYIVFSSSYWWSSNKCGEIETNLTFFRRKILIVTYVIVILYQTASPLDLG